MFDWLTLHIAALVPTAALFGGMTFFMALLAPLAFKNLPRETAAGFMRAPFPTYFSTMGLVLLAPAAMFFAALARLPPALNRSREAGQERRAGAPHRASVLIHLLQWAIVATVLVRLAA